MSGDTEHEDMRDLVAVAALGALEEHDLAPVSLHLAGCDECREDYARLREAANAVAFSAEIPVSDEQSVRMRNRLFAEIEPRAGAARRRAPSYGIWAAGLAAAAAVLFAITTSQTDRALRRELASRNAAVARDDARLAAASERLNSAGTRLSAAHTELHGAGAELDVADSRLRAADARLAREQTELADLTAPDAERYSVAGGAIVRHAGRLYLALSRLPRLPNGKVYQAWTVPKGSPAIEPSITFTSASNLVRLPGAANRIAAVAVTVEPSGGSKRPTSKPLFLRKLG